MKIILLLQGNFLDKIGGAEKALANVANLLSESGYEVLCVGERSVRLESIYKLHEGIRICNLNGSGRELCGTRKYKILRELTKPLIKKGLVRNYYEGDILKQKAAKLQVLLDQEQPDFLVAFSKDDASILKHVQVKMGKTAVVLQGGERDIKQLLEPQNKDMAAGLQKADFCLVLLPYQKKLLQAKFPHLRIYVVHNEIVVPEIVEKTESKKIVMLARMIPEKRPDLLIKAFALTLADSSSQGQRGSEENWTVHLYGRFLKADFENKIKKLIKDLKLEEKVFLEGETKIPAQVLNQAAIFAFPSASEGFGLALAEAMAAGVPCLAATDCLAACILLERGECGVLRAPEPVAFAQGLKQLMEQKDLRQKLGARGREAVRKYSREMLKKKWEQILQDEHNRRFIENKNASEVLPANAGGKTVKD